MISLSSADLCHEMIKGAFTRRSIRRKFLWLTTLITFASLLVTSSAMIAFEWQRVRLSRLNRVTAMSDVIAATLANSMFHRDNAATQVTLEALKRAPALIGAWILDDSGKIVSKLEAQVGASGVPERLKAGENYRYQGTSLIVEREITSGNEALGVLVIEQGVSDILEWLQKCV